MASSQGGEDGRQFLTRDDLLKMYTPSDRQPSALKADFSAPDNPISLAPVPTLVPSNTPSPNSGGTAHILPEERAKASFDVEEMTNLLDGGAKRTARKRFIASATEDHDVFDKIYWSRPEYMREHIRLFLEIHEEYWEDFQPQYEDFTFMDRVKKIKGSLGANYGLFITAIRSRGTPEQYERFAIRGREMKIVGCYGQTEMGHGSNVRGLMTTATYDKTDREFVINTPTLMAMKWWPGGIGKLATHAIVYAQLIIDGKEYGVHEFIVQIRDENHRPLEGIMLGDVGPKLGDNANDTGFMRIDNVSIPKDRMLAKFQHVSDDGKYVRHKKKRNDKAHYGSMMQARAGYIRGAANMISRASTIATRYSAIRKQGFVDATQGISHLSPERTILDHQVQRYRVFKQISVAYAFQFVSKWMTEKNSEFLKNSDALSEDVNQTRDIAFTTSALKAICTVMTLNGLEDCRKCCGGHGYLLSSGVAMQVGDYCYQTTAEGDFILLFLQTARFLIRRMRAVRQGDLATGAMSYLNALKSADFSPDSPSYAPKQPQSIEDLHDIDYIATLYEYRALVSCSTVSKDFEADIAKGQKWGDAFNSHAFGLVEAAKDHCMLFILKLFQDSVRNLEDGSCKRVLDKLLLLFGLSHLIDDRWRGLISHSTHRYAHRAALSLLEDLRPDAVALVDAFDFPDFVLNSVLGKHDGNVYEALFESAKKSTLNQFDPFLGYEELLRPHLDLEFLKQGNSARYDTHVSKL